MVIGIDYSINSPGLCILNEEGVHFGTLARTNIAKPEFFELLQSFDVHVDPHPKYSAISNSTLDAQGFTKDSAEQAFRLSELCKTINSGKGDPEKNTAIFEGFSFGSKGNRLAQLSGYQYAARIDLMHSGISCYENLEVNK